MMRAMLVATTTLIASIGPSTGQKILDGTWKLVSSKRTTSGTGVSVDTFGSDPKGYIMYGKDGRVMVLETKSDRPRPRSAEGITDEQKAKLFSSMLAYSGTYKFDGTTIEHHIDLSWNELWTGTTMKKHKNGRRSPRLYDAAFSFPNRWSMGFAVLVWERVK